MATAAAGAALTSSRCAVVSRAADQFPSCSSGGSSSGLKSPCCGIGGSVQSSKQGVLCSLSRGVGGGYDYRRRELSSSSALTRLVAGLRGGGSIKKEMGRAGASETSWSSGVGVRAEIYIEEYQNVEEYRPVHVPATQTAWMYHEYGKKENLTFTEVCVPDVRPDQVLVQVHAAALNPVDLKRLLGKFQASDSDLPTVPGYDVAGVVARVGNEVTKFKVGDRVYGDVSLNAVNGPKQYGSLAQYTSVEESLISHIPSNLGFTQAASLPLAVETAYQAFEFGELKEGQTVLVIGGSGGVGSLAIQLAKIVFKASLVAATASTGKVDFVKSLGAEVVIDYTNEEAYVAAQSDKYDVVFDTVGSGEALKFMKEGGKAVTITGPSPPPIFRFVLVSRGDILEKLNPFLEDGSLKPVLDPNGQFKFSDVVKAFGYLETGKAVGKVVVSTIS